MIDQYIPPQSLEEQWDIKGLEERLAQEFGLELPMNIGWKKITIFMKKTCVSALFKKPKMNTKRKKRFAGEETMRHFEKGVMLQTLDELWKVALGGNGLFTSRYPFTRLCAKRSKQEYKKNLSVCLLKCWIL